MAAKKTRKAATKKGAGGVVRQVWELADEKVFRQLLKSGTPTAEIAKQLKRSAASIRSKAQKIGLSLKPKATKARR